MHELSLATDILKAAEASLEELPALRGGVRVTKLRARVGELSGVSADSLRFCLEAGREGTPLETVPVEVEIVRPKLVCADCGEVERAGGFDLVCPRCGRRISGFVGGRGLDVEFECEEPEGKGTA